MIRLALYISKTFVFIWLIVTFGFLILIGLLDSLANGSEIMASGKGFSATFEYMTYRAPVIFDRVLLFTIMVAILLTYVKLIRQHELVALLGFGLSLPKQFLMLAAAVFGVTAASILFINTAMPPAVQALQDWGIGEYKKSAISERKPLWLLDHGTIVRASGRPARDTLRNLQFFKQEANGTISLISWADTAIYDKSRKLWKLNDMHHLKVEETLSPTLFDFWASEQTPQSIAKLAADPRDLSLKDMRLFRTEGNSGAKPGFAYTFWYLHRITRPLAALILLLCAIPLMQKTGREETGDKALIVGIAVGFVYLILDGALSTFAVSGGMGVYPAIAIPLLLFGFLGGYLILKSEDLSA